MQLPQLGSRGPTPQQSGGAAAPAATAWVNPFAAAQASRRASNAPGGRSSQGDGPAAMASGESGSANGSGNGDGSGNGNGGRSKTSSTTSARSNAEAEAAAKAALRRIADPDAPERPTMPPVNAPLLQFPKKERDQPQLRRCNST